MCMMMLVTSLIFVIRMIDSNHASILIHDLNADDCLAMVFACMATTMTMTPMMMMMMCACGTKGGVQVGFDGDLVVWDRHPLRGTGTRKSNRIESMTILSNSMMSVESILIDCV
jgi:hypothetical protein